MVSWPEALERVRAAQPRDLDLRKRRFLLTGGTPLTIAGSSGAGKTKIWSRLTLRGKPNRVSLTTDDGYMLHRHRRPLTLTTIPGQISRSRYVAMEELFGPATRLDGVIFVACHGFDHIWPRTADIAAGSLPAFDMDSLRQRNRREELWSFQDTCNAIIRKLLLAPREYFPKWLLVVVNKLDLYWNDLASAEKYYLPNSGSPFDVAAQDLIARVGTITLQYHVLPVAAAPLGYTFQASRGSLQETSKLSNDGCDASVRCLVDTVEDLSAT